MKKLSILVAAVLATHLFAQEPPKPGVGDVPTQQEKKAETQGEAVTFHVIGMKKTASGAT